MSGSGESNQYAVPAPAGAARVMNTYAGAPPAPPARGQGREGDAGGRREVGHAGMPAQNGGAEWDAQPHERAPEGGTLTSVSDKWREEEEEFAAEAALLCGARKTESDGSVLQI